MKVLNYKKANDGAKWLLNRADSNLTFFNEILLSFTNFHHNPAVKKQLEKINPIDYF